MSHPITAYVGQNKLPMSRPLWISDISWSPETITYTIHKCTCENYQNLVDVDLSRRSFSSVVNIFYCDVCNARCHKNTNEIWISDNPKGLDICNQCVQRAIHTNMHTQNNVFTCQQFYDLYKKK